VLLRESAEGRDELLCRQDAAGVEPDRLQDGRSEFVGMLSKDLFQDFGPVVGNLDELLVHAGSYTG